MRETQPWECQDSISLATWGKKEAYGLRHSGIPSQPRVHGPAKHRGRESPETTMQKWSEMTCCLHWALSHRLWGRKRKHKWNLSKKLNRYRWTEWKAELSPSFQHLKVINSLFKALSSSSVHIYDRERELSKPEARMMSLALLWLTWEGSRFPYGIYMCLWWHQTC